MGRFGIPQSFNRILKFRDLWLHSSEFVARAMGLRVLWLSSTHHDSTLISKRIDNG
jgi:hypothetical protein